MTARDAIPAAQPIIGDDEREAVDRVLRSGMVAQGPEVAAFEREFAYVVADRQCVAVNSGTSALHLALLAVGVGAGDEVLVPSFSFAASANAVRLAGAEAVFVDIEPGSFCMSADAAEAAVTARTKVLLPVHLYGHPAPMPGLLGVAERHGLLIIEDAAQAHAATLRGTPVGAFGAAGAFSFYPTKNMTSGEGGMVTTADDRVARRIRLLRNQGMERRYTNEVIGFNMRMTDIHAAIGRVQLGKLDTWTKQRRDNARFLDENLHGVITPPVTEGAEHVYHQYTVRVPDDRDGFAEALATRGIGTGVYYPTPIHRLPAFDICLDLSETERAVEEVLSLPVHPSLSYRDLHDIADAVNDIARAGC